MLDKLLMKPCCCLVKRSKEKILILALIHASTISTINKETYIKIDIASKTLLHFAKASSVKQECYTQNLEQLELAI